MPVGIVEAIAFACIDSAMISGVGALPTSASIGRALRARRERESLSLARVARECGLTATELDDIESGRARPSIAVFDRIAHAVGSTLADLVVVASEAPEARLGLDDIARAIVELPNEVGPKIDVVEAATVLFALSVCNENQSAAARLLGMDRKAFVRRLMHARHGRLKLGLASSGPRGG